MPELFVLLGLAALLFYMSVIVFLYSGCLRLKTESNTTQPEVTVVVAARNEERRIEACLTALLAQTYPQNRTQVIIVNDRSTDRTGERVRRIVSEHEHVMQIAIDNVPPGVSPKKQALARGIEHARGDLIFTTDADCAPPPDWLRQTVPLFTEDVGVVVGAAPLHAGEGILSRMLALESLATACVAAGAAGWNIGVTCSGRNFAYRKAVYEQVNGFAAFAHSLSGDDDLFLQRVSRETDWSITHTLTPETAVPSPALDSFSDYIKQRRRHVSASKYYSKPIQAAYFMFNLANLYLYAFVILALQNRTYLMLAAGCLLVKFALDFQLLNWVARKLKRQRLLSYFGLWEIFFLMNQVLISPLGLIGKIRWKG